MEKLEKQTQQGKEKTVIMKLRPWGKARPCCNCLKMIHPENSYWAYSKVEITEDDKLVIYPCCTQECAEAYRDKVKEEKEKKDGN